MKRVSQKMSVLFSIFMVFSATSLACETPASICFEQTSDGLPLIANGQPASVIIDANADTAIQSAAKNFTKDLRLVSGNRAKLLNDIEKARDFAVVIGVAGSSALIDGLAQTGQLDLSDLQGKWEGFEIKVVDNPWPNIKRALVIVGSDRRGAVFGTYDISEEIGVSPWYWFADVPVQKRTEVSVVKGERQEQPQVRYRGFFINDEDPGLSGWANEKFGGLNADFYEHVFELLLRMKGNYIWPAMWAPKSFHLDDAENADLAHNLGVVMGTSHHEPLTRAQAEWHRIEHPDIEGPWDYQTNAENLREFWRLGLKRMMEVEGGRDNLLTIGMRGDGDAPMSEGTATKLLETIVSDQRELIEEVTGKPAEEVPQLWALYKEVQDYYDQGMRVPDDVTLLFADDNWGQIRRLPTKDIDREGGFGVYYHFDYVGVPRNYKWLNTVQIEKVWQQMNLAYSRKARDIWIVNVGDIKPIEYPLEFFMDMAWNPNAMTSTALEAYPSSWAAKQFGYELGGQIGDLITRYSRLASKRKPELVNASTYKTGEIRPDVLVRGEWSSVVEPWRKLVADLEIVKADVSEAHHDAFFQLVEFPILAVSNLYEMYYAAAWNKALASHFDPRGNYFVEQVEERFVRDAELTKAYHSLANGKWNQMMSQVHTNYIIWNDPTQQTQPTVIFTAGDVPEKMRSAAPVFVDPTSLADTLTKDAGDVDRIVSAADIKWSLIAGLGGGSHSLVALPQGRLASEVGTGTRAEFDFVFDRDASAADLNLKLLPTLNTIGKAPMRIGVSLDNGPVEVLNFDLEPTGGAQKTVGQKNWADAVVQNGVELSTTFNDVSKGKHTVKVWRIDDNIIVDGLTVRLR